MESEVAPPDDALKIQNIRKAPDIQGHSQKSKGEPPNPSTIISIPKQPRALLVEKEKEENVRKWTITNCDSLSDALQFFDTTSLKKELSESINILLLRFEVNEDFIDLNSREIFDLASKCQKKSILILLTSTETRKFSIFWKSSDIGSLLALKPYKERLTEEQMELNEFVALFLINSLKAGNLGLHSAYTFRSDSRKIELHLLADPRGYNLLLLAVESGDTIVGKMLLESGLSPDLPESSVSAQSIAVDSGHFNVLLMLLQSNLPYPSNLDFSKCPANVQQFIESSKTLRKALKDKEVDKVEEILHSHKNVRHFYTITNESAPKFAIENNLIDMYEVLLTNKVLFGPHEDVIDIMNKLDYDEKRHLREVHFKHSIDMPEKHTNTLMANSYVGHEEVANVQEKLNHVQNAFKLLNENPFIKIILLIVAASKKFRIIFDFNRDSVELIDPTAQSYTAGLFYLSGRMYIGAKQLLDKATQNEAIATIAHELCHYAMNLVYNNDANPYKKDDKESQDQVEDVSRECQEKSGTEDIVDMVYECYPEDMHHAELIVRAPHMMAYYHNQPEELKNSKDNFTGLFKLYEEKVVPEMEKALPEIEARVEKEMAKKDKEIFNLKKRFYLAIIVSITLLIGVGTFAFVFRKNAYEYRKLSLKYRKVVEDHSVIYAGTKVNLNEIFESNSSAYYTLQPSAIKHLLKRVEPLDIDTNEFDHLRSLVELNWTTLAEPLREKFLNSNVIFQSEILKFDDLYQNYFSFESLKFISHDEIKQVLFNGSLNIGDMVESGVKFYINRNFIDENINLAYHRFKASNLNVNFEEFYDDFIEKDYDEYHEILHEIEDGESYISNPKKLPLNSDKFKFAQHDFDKIILKANNDTIMILSDEAGSGKTVTFKYLAKFIKSKYPLHWVSYIDSKNFTRKYQEDKDLLDLLKDFLTKSELERKLFDMAYKSNQMFLLWNGFDEISSGFYNEVLSMFLSINFLTDNVQFICTRPTYSHDLRNKFEQMSFKLVPFNVNDRKEFISKHLKSKTNSSNANERIEKTIKRIETLESKSSSSDFNTPLILIMIADIGDDKNALESVNLYAIYETFIQKKIDIWKRKIKTSDEFITKIISGKVNLMQVFQFYALYNELSDFNSINLHKITDLEIFQQKYFDEIKSDSEIARIGILHDDGYGYLKLSHKSFVEFFIAQYLIENIYNSKSCAGSKEAKLRIELFFHFMRVYGHSQWLITDFMKDYLTLQSKIQSNKNVTNEIIKLNQRIDNKKNFHKLRIHSNKNENFNTEIANSIENDYAKAFIELLETDQPQIFEFLFDFFKKDLKIIKILLQFDRRETFYTASFSPILNSYQIDPNMILNLVKMSNVLDEIEFSSFKNEKFDEFDGRILLGMFHYRNGKVKKSYEKFKNVNFTTNSTLCDLFNVLNSSLNADQWNSLLTCKPGSVIIANYLYNSQNYQYCFDSFWNIIDNFDESDKEACLKLSLINYLEISSSPSYPPDDQQLKFILSHFKRILKPERIIELFFFQDMLHRGALKFENFIILWEFYIDNYIKSGYGNIDKFDINSAVIDNEIDLNAIQLILLTRDSGTFMYDDFNLTRSTKNGSNVYNSRFFDGVSQTILYRGMTNSKNVSNFHIFTSIYKKYLNNSQIKESLTESIMDLFCFISLAKLEICTEFVGFLNETFQNDMQKLKLFLNKEVEEGYITHDYFKEIIKKRLQCSNKIYDLLRVNENIDSEVNEQNIHLTTTEENYEDSYEDYEDD